MRLARVSVQYCQQGIEPMNTDVDPHRPRLRMSDHVRMCIVDDQAVLLDLNRSRYIGLSSRQWEIVAATLALSGSPATGSSALAGGAALVAPLIRAQLLTTSPIKRAHRLVPLASAVASFDSGARAPEAGIGLRCLYDFAAAAALAAMWLRLRSLEFIVQKVERRNIAHELSNSPDRDSRLGDAVSAFDRLRPLAFTSKDKCLYDSLALALFLARRGVPVRWVIGVATRPFRAHSWVQDGGEVLNDLHDNVRRYSPILIA